MIALITVLLVASASPSASPAVTAAPSLPDGTYTYVLRQGASALGGVTISVQHADGSIKTHEIATLLGRSYTIDQTIDPGTFVPQSLDGVYPGAQPTAIHAKFGAGLYTETIAGMPGSKSATPPSGTKGLAVLDGPVMSGFFLVPAEAHSLGTALMTGYSPGSLSTLTLKIDAADRSTRPTNVAANASGLTISGLPSGAVTTWFDPTTFVAQDFEIPAQGVSIVLTKHAEGLEMHATPAPAPTPLPTATPHFSSHDVVFRSSDGTQLAGTLTVPDSRPSRLPAVVLVQGSGPITRDEVIGPNPIFLELSNALSNHGFVVLRYDKRGIGKSGGDAKTMTRDQLLADARAAIAFVGARSEVDRRAVFIVGHSEGGELAPSLAAAGAPLRGIALMAPPALPLARILIQQATRGLHGKAARDAADAQAHANLSILDGVDTRPGTMWLRSSFPVDPASVIAQVPCPILVLQGGKDQQVLASDLPRLVNAAHAAHRDISVRVFPDDDHLFITVPRSAQATFSEYFVPHRIDPAMIETLESWLDAHKVTAR